MQVRRATTVVAVALFVAGSALAQTQATYTPPPRTVDDVLAVFDEYRPDPKRVNELRARAAEQPPPNADPKSLAQFYLRRGQTARLLGGIYFSSKASSILPQSAS